MYHGTSQAVKSDPPSRNGISQASRIIKYRTKKMPDVAYCILHIAYAQEGGFKIARGGGVGQHHADGTVKLQHRAGVDRDVHPCVQGHCLKEGFQNEKSSKPLHIY